MFRAIVLHISLLHLRFLFWDSPQVDDDVVSPTTGDKQYAIQAAIAHPGKHKYLKIKTSW